MRPTLAIVAAHPDDETVGAAGLLLSAGRAAVVHLTDGAPRDPRLRPPGQADREAYARLRREEALAALEEAGVAAADALALGAVDQEAVEDVASLARDLARILAALRPRIAVVHPFEGGHPDHDAAAVVARAAAALLARRGAPVPRLVELTSYHLRGHRLECGVFLDGPAGVARRLPPAELAAKRRMVARYASQREVLAAFPRPRWRPSTSRRPGTVAPRWPGGRISPSPASRSRRRATSPLARPRRRSSRTASRWTSSARAASGRASRGAGADLPGEGGAPRARRGPAQRNAAAPRGPRVPVPGPRYFREEVRPRLGPGARFLGPLSLGEKARLLAAARCLVVPSLAPETSSLVAMEALASGTPVVALRVGALPEIVDDGRTGFLVSGVDELADAIRASARLSATDCRRAAEARFGAATMIERYLDLYGRLLRRRAPLARPARGPRVPAVTRVEEVTGSGAPR